ncbi:helix-turn-helix domain-containing protein [Frigidibacter albus]|uniref:Helix-turn-helix domain-containing protein n=1 Tax=Frigidibacter albus TaxID=1465486 RepID=A0A6L8VED5_9RHOB|nr:AraC family transcriptional regulator [Frigidibacter albus]MZQ87600.1 helix-turn-helix domain-containing protein [Frigidibacter albus]NBE29506.1 helix-turn-helix domain-containing protein [Frigidibacter albus]GGH44436.1 AraC family transcriptional regulator [Frigidibacter albus]
MTFRPQMTSFTQGIRPLGPLRWRAWDGIVADLWHVEGQEGGGGHYLSPDPRLVVFLDDGAAAVDLSERADFEGARAEVSVLYVPAGRPLWSRITRASGFSHLDLHFDAGGLDRRLAGVPGLDLARPVLMQGQPRLRALAGMLAAECATPARHSLMLDGLTQALLAEVFALPPEEAQAEARGGLTPHQLRSVTAHMRARLDRRVAIAELAAVVGLSESWFAHAFKHSTGQTPHRWQMQMRIARARALLEDRGLSLAAVADATGFADQAHLTRAFRSLTGTTPAAWRRNGPSRPAIPVAALQQK